jgi:hypothetical protein
MEGRNLAHDRPGLVDRSKLKTQNSPSMKQFFTLFIGTALITAGCSDSKTTAPAIADDAKPTDSLPKKYFGLTESEIFNFQDSIDLKAAATLIYYYKKERVDNLQSSLKKDDSRFVTYPLDELIAYLVYAKETVQADGVRVYFGVHSPQSSSETKNSQTVVFVPTVNQEDKLIRNNFIQTKAYDEGQLCPPPYTKCNHLGAKLMMQADSIGFVPSN